MNFELIFNLENSKNTLENHKINLQQYITLIGEMVITDGVCRQNIIVNDIKQLIDLGFYFDRDIKICGTGMNILKIENINE